MTAEQIQNEWDNSTDWNKDYNRLLREANKIGYKIKGYFAKNNIPDSLLEIKKINKTK